MRRHVSYATARLSVGGLCAGLTLLALSTAPAAAAPAVSCGATLTSSVTLTQDILECPQGLTVGADNVTINLNGHTLAGSYDAPVLPRTTGVTINGHSGVTVRNGTIAVYNYSVVATDAPRTTLRGLSMRGVDTDDSVQLTNTPDSSVLDSTFETNGADLQATGADRLRFSRNRAGAHAGVKIEGDGVVVSDNYGHGSFTMDFTITGNGAQVLRNVAGYSGIQVNGDRNRIEGNQANDLSPGIDALYVVGNDNVIRNNVISNSSSYDFEASLTVVGDRNQLLRNRVTGAVSDSGIFIDGAGNVARGNVTIGNAEHGIKATQPVAGSNTASGNGADPQCVNVTCVAAPL